MLALVHGTESGALSVVAGIYQQHMLVSVFELILDVGKDVIAQRAVDVAVDIVGVQDHDVVRLGIFGHDAGDHQTKQHDQNQHHGDFFTHFTFLPK